MSRTIELNSGSSPLARGPLCEIPPTPFSDGLIPARAGTTVGVGTGGTGTGAHPRSRGDHRRLGTLERRYRGSSPLARGPRGRRPDTRTLRGLIPARAGTTSLISRRTRCARAHPRSRGDHRSIRNPRRAHWGSSPLARGPRGTRRCSAGNGGLIPARAGTTVVTHQSVKTWGAHPRSRGDHY